MQRMHEGLYHQDVVGLEQEYADKSAQFSEQSRASKTQCTITSNNGLLVVNEVPTNTSNSIVPCVNDVPTTRSNNVVPSVNEVPDVTSNKVDPFVNMYPSALDHLIPKLNQAYPHYKVFRNGTKYKYRTVKY